MTPYIIRSSIFGIAALLALTFIPAGTLDYWQGCAYVATWVIACSAYTAYLAKHDPALFKRRTEVGVSHEKEPAQKVIVSFMSRSSCSLFYRRLITALAGRTYRGTSRFSEIS
jgi:hypothetical protein